MNRHGRRDAINEGTGRALDKILPYVRSIKQHRGKRAVAGLLNDAGSEYERRGPLLARVLVVGKKEDSSYEDKRDDLNRLVQIIDILSEENLPGAVAGYVLKKLDAIREFYVPEEETWSQ